MDPHIRDKQRFSLLLLEPNEIYFDNYSVDLMPSITANMSSEKSPDNNNQQEQGRFKLCSKSLVFEPKNTQLAIIKIRFSDIEKILSNEKNILFIKCSQYIEMLENNIIAPYKFIRNKNIFAFRFYYADVDDYVLQLCQQLHRASSLSAIDQNDMIATIIYSRSNRIKFNPLWMDNIYEQQLFNCKVDEIHPLVTNPGKILLTNICIYLQQFNNIQSYPVLKIKLSNIKSLTKRRYLLKQTGLEITWDNNESPFSIYISFTNFKEREEFVTTVLKQSSVNIKNIEAEAMTLKWQNRLISNYEYLMYLNSLADRSFEDLSQYPIFPWIINDYKSDKLDLNDENIYRDLSKPIGALNPERLKRLKERAEEMDGGSRYLYGSHYSTPGFILFYLVRKYPHLMLCLQNGRFDHPDRMFNRVLDTFNNCLTNMSDFKELIPEFYDTTLGGDFLVNTKKINFGLRSDGLPVNNVELPPWANSSPQNFIETLRNALESDFVSSNLHHWIDLIFGYKQRGEEAVKADNVFYPLCYEGSIDLDTIKDPIAKHALEVQISEFGQIPKQLFNRPHVSRMKSSSLIIGNPMTNHDEGIFSFDLELMASYIAHKEQITSLLIDDDVIISTGKDGVLKFYEINKQNQTRSVLIDTLPISSCVKISNSNVYVVGSWNNTISLYNCNYGKIFDVIPAHDDTVSSLSLIPKLGILISGSWDCSVKIWKGFAEIDYGTFRLSNSMVAYYSFDDRITCLTNRYDESDGAIDIIISTEIGQIFLWNLKLSPPTNNENFQSQNIVQSEPQLLLTHNAEISCIEFNYNQTKLASCSLDGNLMVTDISTGMTLLNVTQDYSITNLCWCGETDFLLSVDTNGYLSIWDLIQGNLKTCKKLLNNGSLTCVKYSKLHKFIIIAGKDGIDFKISCWLLK